MRIHLPSEQGQSAPLCGILGPDDEIVIAYDQGEEVTCGVCAAAIIEDDLSDRPKPLSQEAKDAWVGALRTGWAPTADWSPERGTCVLGYIYATTPTPPPQPWWRRAWAETRFRVTEAVRILRTGEVE